MDDGDRGQQITDKLRAWAINMHLQRPRSTGYALRQCVDCGETIEEARRLAQPGCKRCVACQKFFEKRK